VGRYGTKHGGANLTDDVMKWPTPNTGNGERGSITSDGRRGKGLETEAKVWPTPRAYSFKESHLPGLTSLDAAAKNWPTATSQDSKASDASGYSTESGRHSGTTLTDAATRNWMTPAARDSKGAKAGPKDVAVDPWHGLQDQTETGPKSKKILNPRFVDWLMGFPIAWTACDVSEMQSFLSWQRKHLLLLREGPGYEKDQA